MSRRRGTRLIAGAVCTALVILAGLAAPARGTGPADGAFPPWLGAVPGLGDTAPDEMPEDVPVELSGCTITNPMFRADRDHVSTFVPDGYVLGSNAYFTRLFATVMTAVLACDGATIAGEASGATVLNLVAVQVKSAPSNGGPVDGAWDAYNQSDVNFLPSSSWYLVAAHTNNGALAGVMRDAGFPVAKAARLEYSQSYGGEDKSDSLSLRSAGGQYGLSTTTRFADPFVHNHDWWFWHDARGQRPAGFFLHLHAMSDSSCGYHLSAAVQHSHAPCGATVTAPAGSVVAELLGESATTPYAFNHPASSQWGYITFPSTE